MKILILAWLIGQFGYAAVSVYVLQKGKKINYWKAWALYFSAEIGSFVMAFSALLIILFIAPDFINTEVTRKDLINKDILTWKERFILYQRTSAVGISAFSQHLLYLIFKKGKKKIEEYEKENNISD